MDKHSVLQESIEQISIEKSEIVNMLEEFKINIKDIKGRFLYFYEYTEDEDIVVSPLYYNK